MKIAITSLIKNRGWILKEFLDKISDLHYNKKDLYLIFLDDFSNDNSLEILEKYKEEHLNEYADIIILKSDIYYSDNVNSRITKDRNNLYQHLCYLRNKLISICTKLNVNYQFSIDSDILVSKDILNHLLSFNKDYIASIILNDNHLLTKFDYNDLLNRYINASIDLNSSPIHFKNYELNKIYKVEMSGACYLIKNNLFKIEFKNHRFGEDTGYCLQIENKYLSTYLKAIHVMEEKYKYEGLEYFNKYFG